MIQSICNFFRDFWRMMRGKRLLGEEIPEEEYRAGLGIGRKPWPEGYPDE